ncbi:MAG: hypothetical protein U0746_13640 [Gemmataceae bacterium]
MEKYAIAVFAGLTLVVTASAQSPVTGKVLLLKNRHVLEGDVANVGDTYRVARAGGETLIPADQVLAVCADLAAAYKVLLTSGNPRDGEHRLTLAKWCFSNGLRPQAAAEAQAAAELRPNHRESLALAKSYAQLSGSTAAYAPRVSTEYASPGEAPADCTPEALERFTVRVQPVLMNACASCHVGPKAVKFRLERAFPDSPDKRRVTQVNLTATFATLDRAKPAASSLLTKALVAHGGATVAPLRDRGVPAFKVLEDWVMQVAGAASPPTSVVTVAATVPAGTTNFAKDEAKPDAEKKDLSDPFDPAEFNRQKKKD